MRAKDLPLFITACRKANVVGFIWGESGGGKSQITNKYTIDEKLEMIDLRLGQMEEGDLIGLPRIKEINGETHTIFTIPEWWPKEGTKGILFLDEFNRASSIGVLQAMFQLLLPVEINGKLVRRLHNHILPEGWSIICAGNPDTSDYMVQALDIGLLNRVVQVKLDVNPKESNKWMRKNLKTKELADFVATDPKFLGKKSNFEINVPLKPRSYEMLDNLISAIGLDTKEWKTIGQEICVGTLGSDVGLMTFKYLNDNLIKPITATELFTTEWKELYKNRLSKMITNKIKRTELLSITNTNIIEAIKEDENIKLNNLVNYLKAIPTDLSLQFLLDAIEETNAVPIFELIKDEDELIMSLFRATGFDEKNVKEALDQLEEVRKEYGEEK